MRKTIILLLLAVCVVFGRARNYGGPLTVRNISNTFTDTILVDSLDVEYSEVYWQCENVNWSLLIEAFDDSTAGFASDSACASVELLQVWPYGGGKHFVVLGSRAHLDSAIYVTASTALMLWDSLHIADMDTAAKWVRSIDYYAGANSTDSIAYFIDELDSVETSTHGAFAYTSPANKGGEYSVYESPGIVIKLTGLLNNLKNGSGSRWIITITPTGGQPVYNKQ